MDPAIDPQSLLTIAIEEARTRLAERGIPVEAPLVDLEYRTVNVFHNDPIYEDTGTMRVPSALATAWQYGDRSIYLAVNLLDQPQTVGIDGAQYTLPPRQVQVIEL